MYNTEQTFTTGELATIATALEREQTAAIGAAKRAVYVETSKAAYNRADRIGELLRKVRGY